MASIGNIRDIQAIWRYTTLRHYVDQLSSKHSKVGIGGDMALVVFLWRKDMLLPLFLPGICGLQFCTESA